MILQEINLTIHLIEYSFNPSSSPAFNGRYSKMAALVPQKVQCELESYYPAGTLVKPPLRQAAGTLVATLRKRSAKY